MVYFSAPKILRGQVIVSTLFVDAYRRALSIDLEVLMGKAKALYSFLSSMNLGLVLLALIALIAAMGSIMLPDSFYNTGLFELLLVLLLVNLALCSIGRILQLRKIGALLLHAGIVLVLAGGIIHAHWGRDAEICIIEGQTIDISSMMPTKEPLKLQLDQFRMEFNPDGSPSQYESLVSAVTTDNRVSQYSIRVNHPLHLAGIKAYQQSFGYLVIAHGNSGPDAFVEPGAILRVPDSNRLVMINDYIPSFDPDNLDSASLRPDNPRVILSIYENDVLQGSTAAPLNQPIAISDGQYLTFTGAKPFTVLRLKTDPGLPAAATGGLLVILGVFMALLLPKASLKDAHKFPVIELRTVKCPSKD